MPTWLDHYAFHTCTRIADQVGRGADVRERMKAYCEFSAGKIGMAAFEGACLDADLLPFFDARFEPARAAYRVDPALARGFGATIASDEDHALFQAHVRRVNYTFIDCPPGAMSLGADVEARAVFVKTAQVTRTCGHEAIPGGMAYELVLGRRGRISRHALGFDRACTGYTTHDAEVDACDGSAFEDMPVMDLVVRCGRKPPAIAQTMLNVAIASVAYAKRHAGTDLVRPLRKIPLGDRAARGRRAHPSTSLIDILGLGPSLPGDPYSAGNPAGPDALTCPVRIP